MNLTSLSTEEALAAGGIVGGLVAVMGIFGFIFTILMIIAWWKIFKKAGEAGWKSIIPIYNIYIFCKIIGINFWICFLLLPIIIGIIAAIFPDAETLNACLSGAYALFIDIYTAIKLGDAFKKSTAFKVGLVFFPNIFALILAFGISKYHKPITK